MNVSNIPAWFLGSILLLIVFILILLLTGRTIHFNDGSLRISHMNKHWIKVTDEEKFTPKCEYRWKITSDKGEYKNSYSYPSVVRSDELIMGFSDSYQKIRYENKKAANFNGSETSVEVYKRCFN